MNKILDRLKIVEFRLSKYAIAGSIKAELKSIIEEIENEENKMS